MLAAFNVTELTDLGYPEKTFFIDPMEPRYQAKDFKDADFAGRTGDFSDQVIFDKMTFFANLDAYAHEAHRSIPPKFYAKQGLPI